jgi:predicted ester cyclase
LAFAGFPDAQITIEDLVAEGENVVSRWTVRGTHRGKLMGISPTNKPVTVIGIDVIRYQGGRRIETRRLWDGLGFLQQVGVVPSPGPSR